MKIPMSWLKEYVDINCGLKQFTHKMTMSGSKVEGTESPGSCISSIVTGKILSIEKHPNADKLLVTKVDAGNGTLQIVTGASNLREGDFVPVALHGSVLADGKQILKGALRGVESEGMLCSVEELGYTCVDYPEAPEDGIYVFQTPQQPGADVRPILELCDDIVEFELTSNRPDCFSVIGMAREAAAVFGCSLKFPQITVKETASGKAGDFIAVEIKNPELCLRYCARVVKNVKIAPSPQWMRHRLTAAGVRPVNNIVDITNYVMLELGQPMHAFDIDAVSGGVIVVRTAMEGERITTLDGNERELGASMLLITDREKAVGIAGVMGGENSKITDGAGAVLFESACFDGASVRLTAKKLGLRTDSSSKFEKGLDPNLALIAANRAAQLVEELCAGEVVPGIVDVYPKKRVEWQVSYSFEKINALLGTAISEAEMENMLGKLEIRANNGIAVIPTFRPDLTLEADLAEEVARLYGYDEISATLAAGTPTLGKKSPSQVLAGAVRDVMTAQGYSEALTYAFESPKVFGKLNIPEGSDLRTAAVIKNPLGEDFSIMRTTTLNAALTALSLNYSRRVDEAMLFELAKIYLPESIPLEKLPRELEVLTVAMYGPEKDFYDIKGAVEILLEKLNITGVKFSAGCDGIINPPHDISLGFLHPGRRAYIAEGGELLGYAGEVHPDVLSNYNIGVKAYVSVIYMEMLAKRACIKTYESIPKFPGIKRDIAVVVNENVTAGDLADEIRAVGGEFLAEVTLFDVYKGKNVDEGYKSLAFSLSFRTPERTLKDEEAAEAVKNIVERLEEKFDAKLRDR